MIRDPRVPGPPDGRGPTLAAAMGIAVALLLFHTLVRLSWRPISQRPLLPCATSWDPHTTW